MSEPSPPVVFFVDDEEGVRKASAKVLRMNGYEVLQAGTADEAFQVIESFNDPIDVLLMDINLPDGWGGTVAQRLVESHPEMVVVYTTGFADSDPILSSALNDAPWVLRKPFSSADLLKVLDDARKGTRPG